MKLPLCSLLLLLLVPTVPGVPTSCPRGCWCSPVAVDCSSASLLGLPPALPLAANITTFSAAGNRISALPQDVFASLGLVGLTRLELQSNKLASLEAGAFHGLPALAELLLSHNRLAYLAGGAFDQLQRLQELHLRYNRIQVIHKDAFRSLRNLRTLDLSYNMLTTLNIASFLPLRKVAFFKLEQNPLVCDCELREVFMWIASRRMMAGGTCIPESADANKDWEECDSPKPPVQFLGLPTLPGFLEFAAVFGVSYVMLVVVGSVNRNR